MTNWSQATESTHARLVRELMDSIPGARRGRLIASIRKEIPDAFELEGIRVIPDVYRIDHEYRYVVLYEVEVTSHVSLKKMKRYAHLWSALDCWTGWGVVLVKIDKDGRSIGIDVGNWAVKRSMLDMGLTPASDEEMEAWFREQSAKSK